MKTCRKKQKAFTLLEVMIASVMGAFIALVALGALRSVTVAKQLISDNTSAADELSFAVRRIHTDLINLYRDSDRSKVKFIGTIEEGDFGPVKNIIFRTVSMIKARPAATESDIYEVQYFLRRDEDGSVLLRRYCPIVGSEDDTETTGGILTVIAEDIIDFDLQYFDGTDWLQEWSENSPPQLVEVTITFGRDPESKKDILTKSFIVGFPRMPRPQRNNSNNNQNSSS